MKTTTSRRTMLIRTLLILPLLTGLTYSFSTTEEVQKPLSETENTVDPVQEGAHQRKATSEMLREYDSLVRHYNSFGDNTFVKQRDMERMNAVYNIMTPEQKKKVAPRKFKPVPPPIPVQWAEEKEATLGMIEEYNKLARHYSSRSEELDKSRAYDFLRMKHIYSKMTADQRKNAEPLPDLLPSSQGARQDSISKKERKEGVPGDQNLVITENINVHILKDGDLLINKKKTTWSALKETLSELTGQLPPDHKKSTRVDVWVESEVPMEQVQKVEDILRSHGMSQIKIIFKSLIDVPEKDYYDPIREELKNLQKLNGRYPAGIFQRFE